MSDNGKENGQAERPAHWFKPGVCSNPGGRPKGMPDAVKQACREGFEKGLPNLIKIAEGKSGKAADSVKAMALLADRGYGKEVDINLGGQADNPILIESEVALGLSETQLERILAIMDGKD